MGPLFLHLAREIVIRVHQVLLIAITNVVSKFTLASQFPLCTVVTTTLVKTTLMIIIQHIIVYKESLIVHMGLLVGYVIPVRVKRGPSVKIPEQRNKDDGGWIDRVVIWVSG